MELNFQEQMYRDYQLGKLNISLSYRDIANKYGCNKNIVAKFKKRVAEEEQLNDRYDYGFAIDLLAKNINIYDEQLREIQDYYL